MYTMPQKNTYFFICFRYEASAWNFDMFSQRLCVKLHLHMILKPIMPTWALWLWNTSGSSLSSAGDNKWRRWLGLHIWWISINKKYYLENSRCCEIISISKKGETSQPQLPKNKVRSYGIQVGYMKKHENNWQSYQNSGYPRSRAVSGLRRSRREFQRRGFWRDGGRPMQTDSVYHRCNVMLLMSR